jgi:PHP family Zn ribbon phosphoesterase
MSESNLEPSDELAVYDPEELKYVSKHCADCGEYFFYEQMNIAEKYCYKCAPSKFTGRLADLYKRMLNGEDGSKHLCKN